MKIFTHLHAMAQYQRDLKSPLLHQFIDKVFAFTSVRNKYNINNEKNSCIFSHILATHYIYGNAPQLSFLRIEYSLCSRNVERRYRTTYVYVTFYNVHFVYTYITYLYITITLFLRHQFCGIQFQFPAVSSMAFVCVLKIYFYHIIF